MIKTLIEILSLDDFIGYSKNIDIAKGVNKLPKGIKEGIKQEMRKRWQRKEQ